MSIQCIQIHIHIQEEISINELPFIFEDLHKMVENRFDAKI